MDHALQAIRTSLEKQGHKVMRILNKPILMVNGTTQMTLEKQIIELLTLQGWWEKQEYNLNDPQLTQKLTQAISKAEHDNHNWVTETING